VSIANMTRWSSVLVLLLFAAATAAQDHPQAGKYDVKRCTPKVVKHGPVPKKYTIGHQDQPTGYGPLITFEVLESGDVANAHLKRRSGYSTFDDAALKWIRGTKYNSRPGCGVIEEEASVLVHFSGRE
jgi:TonB family protein